MSSYEAAQAKDASLQKTLEYMAKVDADVPYIYPPVNASINFLFLSGSVWSCSVVAASSKENWKSRILEKANLKFQKVSRGTPTHQIMNKIETIFQDKMKVFCNIVRRVIEWNI